MPEEVHSCVEEVKRQDGVSESDAWAICQAEQKAVEKGVQDLDAFRAVAIKEITGEWPGVHPAEKHSSGREHLLDSHGSMVDKTLDELKDEKSTKFKADLKTDEGMHVLFKEDDGKMLIWGPASVEMVDKENDRITTEALKDALPQLMRRERLSLEHTDQLVGDIKEAHEFDEPQTVKVNGETVERQRFPTDVLKSDDDDVPHDGLYVAGEVWADTKQAEETQKDISDGVIDSYSISGEAIESSTRVKDGNLVDDIKSMDLSAVTLCEEGMNQKAKFATLAKSEDARDEIRRLVKEATESYMPDNEDNETEGGVGDEDSTADNVSESFTDEEKSQLKSMFQSVVKEQLPDGELATKEDIPDDDAIQEKVNDFVAGSDASDSEDEKNLDSEEAQDALSTLAEEYPDLDQSELEEIVSNAAEGADSDDEISAGEGEEGDMPDDMPDEMEEEEEDEKEDDEIPYEDGEVDDEDDEDYEDYEGDETEDKMPGDDGSQVDHDVLEEELPDDLYETVTEHLSSPDGEMKEDEEEESEENSGNGDSSSDGETEEKQKSVPGGDMDNPGASGQFEDYAAEVTATGMPSLEDDNVSKSFEGDGSETEPSDNTLADEFYES